MSRKLGTVVMGLRGPIINQGDNLVQIVCDTLMEASAEAGFQIQEKDVLTVTESVLARAQGNYVTTDQIAADVTRRLGSEQAALVCPIYSRNRFAIILRGIAKALKKLTLVLTYPTDEVGNELGSRENFPLYDHLSEVYDEAQFRARYGDLKHPITGMDYAAYYRELCHEEGCEAEVIFANDPRVALNYAKAVITCDIHDRKRTKEIVAKADPQAKVLALYELMSEPVGDSGYNADYGVLGSNKSSENKIKLFPRDAQTFVREVQAEMLKRTGVRIEVMVYGDGAFKDPSCRIWELADPVVSPGYTDGLKGTPSELKLKYLADDRFGHLSGEAQAEAISQAIRQKSRQETAGMSGQGTTPRQITDLLGSLSDLTSGSGDKGTPFIYIKGYFDSYVDD